MVDDDIQDYSKHGIQNWNDAAGEHADTREVLLQIHDTLRHPLKAADDDDHAAKDAHCVEESLGWVESWWDSCARRSHHSSKGY